jgi:signal transduction histidine kinase
VTALDLLQGLSQVVWVALAAIATIRSIRRPTRTNGDIALFFLSIGGVLAYSRVAGAFDLPAERELGFLAVVVLLAAPYLLLRLVRDFGGVRASIQRLAEIGLALTVLPTGVLVFGAPAGPAAAPVPQDPLRIATIVYLVVYFAAVSVYCAIRSAQLAAASHGMTRQRMQAVALGSYFLGISLLLGGIGAIATAFAPVTGGLTQLCFLAAAVFYGVGFVPPNALRRYWQIPELRSFIARASTLPRATMNEIVDDLASVAGRALGARATIGIWDEPRGVLRFRDPHGALPTEMGPSRFIAWRVFTSQQPMYVDDVSRAHPENALAYRTANVGPVLVAPITAGPRRLGVLEVFAPREPLFAEDDLEFVELIAQQAAVLLEARSLIDDAARVRAQEEAALLKEDFVSAAAHDLKTPLTTIVAQAQLLERRALREGRSAELEGLRRLMRETGQLSRLVEELLDASRLERGAFSLDLEDGDLVELAREVATRDRPGAERVEVVAEGDARARSDPDRVRQLMENLVENALKYSPEESPVTIRVWSEGGDARISVTDRGIGIPVGDLPHVFERFRRGSNVDHRRFAGIGLGLYICRGIVERHGGRIWVESEPGRSTSFHVALPAGGPAEQASDEPAMTGEIA